MKVSSVRSPGHPARHRDRRCFQAVHPVAKDQPSQDGNGTTSSPVASNTAVPTKSESTADSVVKLPTLEGEALSSLTW